MNVLQPCTRLDQVLLRANPAYRLVALDQLPSNAQRLIRGPAADPSIFGALLAEGDGSCGAKVVCHDTAQLYRALQTPAPLAAAFWTPHGEQMLAAVARLVCDGVLEIQSEDCFVSGPDGYAALYGVPLVPQPTGRIARLSDTALRYAQQLDLDDAVQLSLRLYAYNRQPASPQWQARWSTADAVAHEFGLYIGSPLARLLERHWRATGPADSQSPWLIWRSRRVETVARSLRLSYKLYVSPTCDDLDYALGELVDVLTLVEAPCFKIGRDRYGLLRPDKFIAYFGCFDELREAAMLLDKRLGGLQAHGVPFTAELSGDGLLSWGMDPPLELQAVGALGHESWRLWLTNQLAVSLLTAKRSRSGSIEPWIFARERLRLEGVDPDTWTPVHSIWDVTPSNEGHIYVS